MLGYEREKYYHRKARKYYTPEEYDRVERLVFEPMVAKLDKIAGILFLSFIASVVILICVTCYIQRIPINKEVKCVYKYVKMEGIGGQSVYFYFIDNNDHSYVAKRPIGCINEFKVGEKYKNVKRIK